MSICMKTGGKVWIEEVGKIYSADIHQVTGGTYIVYHATAPLAEEVWQSSRAIDLGAEYLAMTTGGDVDPWYREAARVWAGSYVSLVGVNGGPI